MPEIVDTVHTHTHTHTCGHLHEKNQTNQRQSNFEILRIICMFLIIMHHYALYSGFVFSEEITLNRMIVQGLTIGGKIGVNIFILITGYFTIHSQFKIKKVFRLIMQVFTYTFLFLMLNIRHASFNDIMSSLFPITYVTYWFITNYIVLYILSPFINKWIECMQKNELRKLLIILFIIQSIIPSISLSKFEFSNLMWFITLYMLGAYINKYYKKTENSKKINIIVSITSYILIFITVIIFDLLGTKIELFKTRELYFSNMNSILVLANSISVFLLFRNMNLGKNKIINKISNTVFGIYIIHDNIFTRNFIWKGIFKGSQYINSNLLIINAILSIITVFIICGVIECLRQIVIEPIQDKFINKIIEKGSLLKNKIKGVVI